jgi:hypothetical protein
MQRVLRKYRWRYSVMPIETLDGIQTRDIHPVDAVMNRLTGANNARAIITWLAKQEDEPLQDDVPAGTTRYTVIKGL